MSESAWSAIRFLVVPLLSLAATALLPISSPFLWIIWGVAFISVCGGGTSTVAMIRPAFWVGLHVALIFTLSLIQ